MSGADEPAPCFVDTNVLVYAAGGRDRRSPTARQLLDDLMEAGRFRTSVQVLQELYVTLTRRPRQMLEAQKAIGYLDWIAVCPVFTPDYRAVREAIQLSLRVNISYWDALIVMAAARSDAKVLYTEDLQHGQTIMGVEIVNPFVGTALPGNTA